MLINAGQAIRPGRGWWRNLLDSYGANDILIAEAMVHRSYPGGPATATFVARHGPDGQVVGSFQLSGADLQSLMNAGVQRMDQLFAGAFDAGALERDSTLNQPPPPPPPPAPEEPAQPQAAMTLNVQVVSPNALTYNYALAHLRTIPGVDSVQQVNIAIGDVSNFIVSYHGTPASLRAILIARGWAAEVNGNSVRMFVRPVKPAAPQQPAAAGPTNAVAPAAAPKGPPQ
jgi:hypothetical protein